MALTRLLLKKGSGNYEINRFNGLNSVESHTQSNPQPKEIFYGVVPNDGSAKIIDIDGSLYKEIQSGNIDISNAETKLNFSREQKGKHIITDSDYTQDRELSLKMTNTLEQWDKIQYGGYAYRQSKSLLDILYDVFANTLGFSTTQVDSMLTKSIITGNTIDIRERTITIGQYLSTIIVPYAYLEPDSLRATIDKICTLAQLNCYIDENGNIKFVSARPRKTATEYAYPVNLSFQMANPQKDMLLKNKYDGVEIEEIVVDDKYDVNSLVYNTSFEISQGQYSVEDGHSDQAYRQNVGTDQYSYAYVYIEAFYITVNITIPKTRNSNLEQIKKIVGGVDDAGNPNIRFSVNYQHITKNATARASYGNIAVGLITEGSVRSIVDGSGEIDNKYTYTYSEGYTPVSLSRDFTDQTNNKTIDIVDNGDYYSVTGLKILIGRKTFGIGANKNQSSVVILDWTGDCEIYQPQSLEISFYGTKRTISFDNKAQVGNATENSKTVAKIETNTLLQSGTKYLYAPSVGEKISTIIKDNILSDYANGIATARIKSACQSMDAVNYSRSPKNWNIGETYNVNEIVLLMAYNSIRPQDALYKDGNGNPIYFRITGITYSDNGSPILDLELQEVK